MILQRYASFLKVIAYSCKSTTAGLTLNSKVVYDVWYENRANPALCRRALAGRVQPAKQSSAWPGGSSRRNSHRRRYGLLSHPRSRPGTGGCRGLPLHALPGPRRGGAAGGGGG